MHKIIRIICYGKTKEEALKRAKQIFNDRLAGENGQPFDYGTFFDDNGVSRWGKLPAVIEADSKEGKKLIDDGMLYTKDEFMENLKEVKKFLEIYSDEELFEAEVKDDNKKIVLELQEQKKQLDTPNWFQYRCSKCGEYYDGWLYGNDGELIRNPNDLKNVLDKWKCIYKNKKNPYKDLNVYVIPCDIHQ